MELITIGVFGFQALIFLSMWIAVKINRQALNTCAGAWTLFTVLGSIATAGLMLLQMITIIASYIYVTRSKIISPGLPKKSFSEKAGDVWDFIRITIVVLFILGWVISEWVK